MSSETEDEIPKRPAGRAGWRNRVYSPEEAEQEFSRRSTALGILALKTEEIEAQLSASEPRALRNAEEARSNLRAWLSWFSEQNEEFFDFEPSQVELEGIESAIKVLEEEVKDSSDGRYMQVEYELFSFERRRAQLTPTVKVFKALHSQGQELLDVLDDLYTRALSDQRSRRLQNIRLTAR